MIVILLYDHDDHHIHFEGETQIDDRVDQSTWKGPEDLRDFLLSTLLSIAVQLNRRLQGVSNFSQQYEDQDLPPSYSRNAMPEPFDYRARRSPATYDLVSPVVAIQPR